MTDIADLTDRLWANRTAKGLNTTDVTYEFMLTVREVSEAFDAWRKGEDYASELADSAIFLFGLARMLDVDLDAAIRDKMTVNESRDYAPGPTGAMVKVTHSAAPATADKALVTALWERHRPDGTITVADVTRSFNLRTRSWVAMRFNNATNGVDPLRGVALTRTPALGVWGVMFARRCVTCDLWIPDKMNHPHTLEPAAWETS